ncbi:MAG: tetratricopeptide repeat protein, partial [Hyphomicrobiaceae bacterium]
LFHLERARILKRMKRYDDARVSLKRAQALWPQDAGILHHLADIAYKQKDAGTAFELWRQALEIEPHEPTPLRQYAYNLYRTRNLDESARLLERAKIYSGGDEWVHYMSARVAYKRKNYAGAVSGFAKARSLKPQKLRNIYWGGASYYMMNRDCRAVPLLTAYVAQCRQPRNARKSVCSSRRTKWAGGALARYATMSKCQIPAKDMKRTKA